MRKLFLFINATTKNGAEGEVYILLNDMLFLVRNF